MILQQCVRRKAELSVAMNPFAHEAAHSTNALAPASSSNEDLAQKTTGSHLQTSTQEEAVKAVASKAVEAVWDVCYTDTAPFERVP